MRTLMRAFIWLMVVVWLGAVTFFPVVAASAFGSVSDTHVAGTIVRKCLLTLHYEGLVAGVLIIVLLLSMGAVENHYRKRVIAPALVTFIMLALTAFSQFWIIPKMEGYRIAAGGAIDAVGPSDAARLAFNRLHVVSERVEEGILVSGIVLVILLASESG